MRIQCLVPTLLLAGLASAASGQRLADARTVFFRRPTAEDSVVPGPHPEELSGKSPFLAGFLSYLVPGAGSWYAGNPGRGWAHFGIHMLSAASAMSLSDGCDTQRNGSSANPGACNATVAMVAILVVNGVWSIVDGVQDANARNRLVEEKKKAP